MDKLIRGLIKFGKRSKVRFPVALVCLFCLYAIAAVMDKVALLGSTLRGKAGRRVAAMVMSICMVFTMMPMQAFATTEDEPAIGASSVTEKTIVCESHTAHDDDCGYIAKVEATPCAHLNEDGSYSCAPVLDSGSVSGNIASPSEAEYACDHSDDCGYVEATEGADCTHECELCKGVAKPDCTCPPVDSGEVTHGEGCPLYEAPIVTEQSEAVKNVLALINALPTIDELGEWDIEGEEFPALLAQLRLDVAAARAAFDALTDEGKAAVDATALTKLTELEGILAAIAVPMSDPAITITVSDGTNAAVTVGDTTLQAAITASGIAPAAVKTLTITAGEVTTADWTWFADDSNTASTPVPVLSGLRSFTIEEGVTVAEMPAFSNANHTFPQTIEAVSIPQAIAIGNQAFRKCKELKSVSIPLATSIGEFAFSECILLESANFPEASLIAMFGFTACTALKSANFPKVITMGRMRLIVARSLQA